MFLWTFLLDYDCGTSYGQKFDFIIKVIIHFISTYVCMYQFCNFLLSSYAKPKQFSEAIMLSFCPKHIKLYESHIYE